MPETKEETETQADKDPETTVAVEGDDKPKPKSKTDDPKEEADGGPGENDLVMREGFPALRIPGTKCSPLVDGEEPIPRHTFWSSEKVLDFHPDYLENVRKDCELVFTARDKPGGQAYSAGQTFFLPANMKPRCALEALVKTIFEKHTEHVDKGMFSLEQSGAEWWTLVLDDDEDQKPREEDEEEDEVGLHFDADYELEEQATNLMLHPRLATVTYLSDVGAPTMVFDQKSPPMQDLKKTTLEKGINKAWLSHPRLGKHTVFDGRLLHGAPALFFPSQKRITEEEPPSKRRKISKKRYTLLVNIWLNHWVLDAAVLDDEVCAKLTTPWQAESNLKAGDDDDFKPSFTWNDVDLSKPSLVEKISLKPSTEDPAGEDEIALCNHTVTVKYNPTMDECHAASALGSTVELELADGAITLDVGDELQEDESDDENED